MNRRQFLAVTSLSTSGLVGCVADPTTSSPTGSNATDIPAGTNSPARTTTATPSGECGPAATPLSGQFVESGGDSEFCYDGAKPSLAVENEREETIEIAVEMRSANESIFERSYELDPGDRAVENGAVPAQGDLTANVTIDGDPVATGTWTHPSCYRHGIAAVPKGVSFGLVPPLDGPGDTQHDCYAGDSAKFAIYNGDVAQTLNIRVVDHCAESVAERTDDLQAGETKRLGDALVAGGTYDVTIEVEGGGSETYDFDGQCWGITATVDEAGEVSIRQILID